MRYVRRLEVIDAVRLEGDDFDERPEWLEAARTGSGPLRRAGDTWMLGPRRLAPGDVVYRTAAGEVLAATDEEFRRDWRR